MLKISFGAKNHEDIMKDILIDVQTTDKNIQHKFEMLGIETSQKMKNVINDNKTRPQAGEPTKLENAIDTQKFESGWGVGDIDKLKSEAPGWAAINFGSTHLVGKHLPSGTFQPGIPIPTPNTNTGRWKKGKYGSSGGSLYSPLITKPILPMNYIEKTIFWLEDRINDILKNIG